MKTTRIALSIALAAVLFLGAKPASAAIQAELEAPDRYASQVSNVQGWAYTTTPGAELIQPFDVYIDGTKVQQVPCCSDRGDVQDVHPDAPLQTGFSGVINWSRPALEADGPVSVAVVIRDTAGGELTLKKLVDTYPVASFPFARHVLFEEHSLRGLLQPAASGPNEEFETPAHMIDARCSLSNIRRGDGDKMAQLSCRNLAAYAGDGTKEVCEGEIRFRWNRASQGFKQTSYCEEVKRWTNHGNGTATDNDTGLMWELKSGDPEDSADCRGQEDDPASCNDPNDVANRYTWSPELSDHHTGSAFYLFLAQMNDGERTQNEGSYGCYAGYCDWRLPTLDELRTLVDFEACDDGPCTDIPGKTAEFWYWSQTRDGDDAERTWDVSFESGSTTSAKKSFFDNVRAVRGNAKRQPRGLILELE